MTNFFHFNNYGAVSKVAYSPFVSSIFDHEQTFCEAVLYRKKVNNETKSSICYRFNRRRIITQNYESSS